MKQNRLEVFKTFIYSLVIAIVMGVLYGIVNGFLFNGKSSIVELSFVYIAIGIGLATFINNYCSVTVRQGRVIAVIATCYAILIGDFIFAVSAIGYAQHLNLFQMLQSFDDGIFVSLLAGPFRWFGAQLSHVLRYKDFSMIIGYIFRIMGVVSAYQRIQTAPESFGYHTTPIDQGYEQEKSHHEDYQSEVTDDFDARVYNRAKGVEDAVIDVEVEEHDLDD